ncbi:uncharacterized protein LOC111269533 isoform X1 [Varroa jacobsoni]|uniref:Uncharacterized protein n=1 Tax=Varroa destructor TaxID=109461 RepID=A0A7M7MB77_VARDE|nr:uncharacterized protein LOC111245329 [Varroa destructor]XP_022704938.1 uncharacterized protein LOC111269533 isoform X1 [Varroa jacobsoni]
MRSFIFALLVVCVAADNVQTIIEGFSKALEKLDIPDDRRANYRAGLEKSKACIAPLANDAPAERIAVYVEKLTPVLDECSKTIASIPKDQVKQRQEVFGACLKEKVHGADSGFDEKQKEVLPKIKQCIVQAIQSQ